MATMENEEVITLLREIRDLQKLHVENYRDALQNQKVGIEMQAKATRLQRRSLLILLLLVVAAVVILVVPSLMHH
ncbi:MAG TPA: hypothetical protein VKV02_04470 [Acidobacteriaceae bacterium]|nr:hypothetical protein [Acidobacteriaceae bacterium]